MLLWRVTAPHFCAGIVTEDEKIVEAAPILRWAVGKRIMDLRKWLYRRKGKMELVGGDPQEARP